VAFVTSVIPGVRQDIIRRIHDRSAVTPTLYKIILSSRSILNNVYYELGSLNYLKSRLNLIRFTQKRDATEMKRLKSVGCGPVVEENNINGGDENVILLQAGNSLYLPRYVTLFTCF
jgi:hypothetical protein